MENMKNVANYYEKQLNSKPIFFLGNEMLLQKKQYNSASRKITVGNE